MVLMAPCTVSKRFSLPFGGRNVVL